MNDENDENEYPDLTDLTEQLARVVKQKEDAIRKQDFQRAADLRAEETFIRELSRSVSPDCKQTPHQRLVRSLVARVRELKAQVVRLELKVERLEGRG